MDTNKNPVYYPLQFFLVKVIVIALERNILGLHYTEICTRTERFICVHVDIKLALNYQTLLEYLRVSSYLRSFFCKP